MKIEHERFLERVAKEAGLEVNKKTAQQNPLDNSMWENMIDGALKALEIIAISSFDIKLTAIVKLLQSWLKDRREEKRQKELQTQYGAGYGEAYSDNSFSYDFDINPWGY
jgi:uncharacterized protein (DUF305 family)